MPNATQLNPLPPKTIFYGVAGSGKTAFLYTLGEGLQVVETDKGWRTALTLKDKFLLERQKVDIIECYDTDPRKPETFRKAKDHVMKVANELFAKTYKYKYFAIDSLTSLGQGAMRMIQANSGLLVPQPNGQIKPMEIQHWGLAIAEVRNLLEVVRGFTIPVFLLAHERTEYDEKGQVKSVRPNAIGDKLPDEVPTYFDEILHFGSTRGAQGMNYWIRTMPTSSILARTRAGVKDMSDQNQGLPEVMKQIGWTI